MHDSNVRGTDLFGNWIHATSFAKYRSFEDDKKNSKGVNIQTSMSVTLHRGSDEQNISKIFENVKIYLIRWRHVCVSRKYDMRASHVMLNPMQPHRLDKRFHELCDNWVLTKALTKAQQPLLLKSWVSIGSWGHKPWWYICIKYFSKMWRVSCVISAII